MHKRKEIIRLFHHSKHCTDTKCEKEKCNKMKEIITHYSTCSEIGCILCKNIEELIFYMEENTKVVTLSTKSDDDEIYKKDFLIFN